jgi:hypothetical protein
MARGGRAEDFNKKTPDEGDEGRGAEAIRQELNELSVNLPKPMNMGGKVRRFDDGGSARKQDSEYVAGPSYEFDQKESEEAEFNRRLAQALTEATGKEVKQLRSPRSAKDFTMNSVVATLAGGPSDIANIGLQGIDYLREYDANRKAAKENKRGSAKPESVMGRPSIPRIQSVQPKVVEPYASEKPFMGGDQFRDAFERLGVTSKGSQDQFPILGMVPEFALNPVAPLGALQAMSKTGKALHKIKNGMK